MRRNTYVAEDIIILVTPKSATVSHGMLPNWSTARVHSPQGQFQCALPSLRKPRCCFLLLSISIGEADSIGPSIVRFPRSCRRSTDIPARAMCFFVEGRMMGREASVGVQKRSSASDRSTSLKAPALALTSAGVGARLEEIAPMERKLFNITDEEEGEL